jgi:hypothetical protein
MTSITSAVRADLAPTGALRAGMYLRGFVEDAKVSGLAA